MSHSNRATRNPPTLWRIALVCVVVAALILIIAACSSPSSTSAKCPASSTAGQKDIEGCFGFHSSGQTPSPGATSDSGSNESDAETTVPGPANPVAPDTQAKCGVERWSVKTGTDTTTHPGSADVNISSPTPATIEQLTAMASQLGSSKSAPRTSDETKAYTISGVVLTGYKAEADSDYHLVITDPSSTDTAHNHMIVEIPSPACVANTSPWGAQIAQVRKDFEKKTGYTRRALPSDKAGVPFTKSNFKVTVTGVLFYDFLHGQTGVAPNGVELHPLLNISFPP